MKVGPHCPRCGSGLQSPGLWSSSWQCERHGPVHPLQHAGPPSIEALQHITATSAVPVWLPWPLPKGWLMTGACHAGDERTGARATVVACSGPSPLGGVADVLLVAEEPGVGLGAWLAGAEVLEPGNEIVGALAPHAKLHAAGHPTAMWTMPGASDRAVYVGEALGCWLWIVLWPESAGFLLIDDFVLTDMRDAGHDLDLPFGALSPRLAD